MHCSLKFTVRLRINVAWCFSGSEMADFSGEVMGPTPARCTHFLINSENSSNHNLTVSPFKHIYYE